MVHFSVHAPIKDVPTFFGTFTLHQLSDFLYLKATITTVFDSSPLISPPTAGNYTGRMKKVAFIKGVCLFSFHSFQTNIVDLVCCDISVVARSHYFGWLWAVVICLRFQISDSNFFNHTHQATCLFFSSLTNPWFLIQSSGRVRFLRSWEESFIKW